MGGFTSWIRATVIVGGALTVTACSTYPNEPRYSTRPTGIPSTQPTYPQGPAQPQNGYYGQQPAPQPQTPTQSRPYYEEQGVRAPTGTVEGGGLPPAGGPAYPSTGTPTAPTISTPSRPSSGPVIPGVAYVIQPGDTISGVGRRFQTPVQTLIDLNNLGPRGAISQGQRIVLPDSAVDAGSDPYATGPSPVGVRTPNNGVVPPPPAPPNGNAALPPPRAPAVTSSTPASPVQGAAVGQALVMQWPVRGDILRRFGPVGMGERNNGINIGAAAGTEVKAVAAGRVAYVGDDLVGQGLTVLIVHKDGWRTVYGHLGSATVRDGAEVRAGQAIGTVGLTAGDGRPSIHFETRQMRGDDPVAVDPLSILPR